MSEPQRTTYKARCHCGAIRYTVTLPDALAPDGRTPINNCNCSICTKNGYLLVYPKTEDVKFLDGCETKAKHYYCASKVKQHWFCSECSSSILIDFKDSKIPGQRGYMAVNIRLFDDIDLHHVKTTPSDGKGELQPQYEP